MLFLVAFVLDEIISVVVDHPKDHPVTILAFLMLMLLMLMLLLVFIAKNIMMIKCGAIIIGHIATGILNQMKVEAVVVVAVDHLA